MSWLSKILSTKSNAESVKNCILLLFKGFKKKGFYFTQKDQMSNAVTLEDVFSSFTISELQNRLPRLALTYFFTSSWISQPYRESVVGDIFWPVMYQPKTGKVKARKLGGRSKIFLFPRTVEDYGNNSAEICHVMQAGHLLSMWKLQSQCLIQGHMGLYLK